MNLKLLNATGFFTLLFAAQPAHAYLDPGTGSIILQGLIAAVAAVAVTGKLYWEKLKGFFSRKETPGEQSEDELSE